MTTHNPKTKRDRAAGRQHRHTAIQGIINNHQGIIDDIASIDNSIAALQDETCNLGSRLDHWYTILDEKNTHTLQNVAYTMRCAVETERKVAEIEPALALLQEFSRQQSNINVTAARANELSCKTQKAQQDAIAQLNRYTTKLHAKQTNLKHDLAITRIDLADMEKKFITLAWINLGIWVAAALTIFVLLLIVS